MAVGHIAAFHPKYPLFAFQFTVENPRGNTKV